MRDERTGVDDETGTSQAEMSNGLSRRDFIRLNLALIALAGTPACTGPGRPPDGRRIIHLLRADDLLSLQVELINLEIIDRRDRPALLSRADSGRNAFLVVRFPGQHIAEQAFNEADDSLLTLPAKAGIARPSQLVFRLPSSVDAIDLTLASLLDWQGLELQVPEETLAITRDSGQRTTRIELPTGLLLAPQDGVSWKHAVNPVRHNGRVELWHTRLLGTDPASPTRMYIQSPGYLPKTRFPTALEQGDRDHLVGKQADAHTLILSPMGGWLDIRGRWETATGPDITRWEHRATAGQDQKVVLEYNDGFLYPFGHRATVVSVTERRLEPATGNGTEWQPQTAVLRKRDFIVVKTPTRTYDHGDMAVETITVESVVTPALKIPKKFDAAFWIETAPGKPFPFQFSANDWDRSELAFEGAAVFVQNKPEWEETAAALYANKGYQQHRQIALRGQAAAVARYEPETPTDKALPGDAEKEERSAGNTTLHLLLLELAGSPEHVPVPDSHPPFTCRTEAMEVRLPALEPYLDDATNRGWFSLRDPDEPGNKGEVFAVALPERSAPIPMYFDQQADLAGGLAAPSFDVDGLSRIHGPVGDAEQIASGAEIDLAAYFADGKAFLLGVFPLIPLIAAASAGKSLAIPKIEFILARKQPSEKPKPDRKPDPDKDTDEESKNKDDDKPAYWEAGIGLSWKIPLGTAQEQSEQDEKPRVAFEAIREDGKSKCALEIEVKATRRIGGATRPKQQQPADGTAQTTKPDDGAGKSGTDLSASGKIKNFALALDLNDTDGLRIEFDQLSVKLGPPKKAKSKTDDQDPDEDSPSDDDEKKDDKARFEPEIELKLKRIDASGALAFIGAVIAAATKLPLPQLPAGEEPSGPYPAKLPDKGDADLSVTLGPFEAPKFTLLQFEVSRVSATLGIGLNFLPRATEDGGEPCVPDHVFSIQVASADKPLTLLAAPWGGIAHLGLNFTTRQLTAFQYSMGVIYKAEFNLAVTKATCEGSLAAMFTYTAKGSPDQVEPLYQVDLILKLSGQAKLWFFDIHLLLVTVGSWANHVWSFDALLTVRVQIGFFTVRASYGLHYTIADPCKQTTSSTMGSEPDESLASEQEWLAYRRAFATDGVA